MRLSILCAFVGLCVVLAGCGGKVSTTKGDKKLTLINPDDTVVKVGESTQVPIKIEKANITAGVSVRFEGLPVGVSTDNSTQFAQNADMATCTFRGGPNAKAGTSTVRVILETADGMVCKGELKLTVK